MNIGGVYVGSGAPCRFIAEGSNNHNGSLARALRITRAAKDAGASFIKWQAYTPEELIFLRGDGPAPAQWGADGWTMRALYEKARTPLEWFPELFAYARDIEIVPFASFFGAESFDVLESVDSPAYKTAALDEKHEWLREMARRTGKPVLASTNDPQGGATAVDNWLYAPPGYPTKAGDVKLPLFGPELTDDAFCAPIGLSSHCLDPLLPVAAVARGAKLIEMHMMLDDEPSELEADVSLTASQFARMVQDVRRVEVLLGAENP